MKVHLPLFLISCLVSLCLLPSHSWAQGSDPCSTTPSFTALADLCIDAGVQTGLSGASPTGGTYSGPGVTDNGDGTYDFDPSVAGVGPHTLMYSYQASSGWDQLGSELTGNSGSFFGSSVDISSSGNRIIIGALGVDETVQDGGEAYVYEWNGTTWVQLGTDFIGEENNKLGSVVRISNGGNRIAISSPGLALSGRFASGFVRVFDWNGSAWIQVGSDIEASSGNATAFFGTSMDLSGDGNRIVVGNSFFGNKVEVFDWDGNDWNKIGVDLGPERSNDRFGTSVSLSEDGKLLAIGATEDNLSLASPKTGYAKVYQEVGGSWVLTGLKRTGDTDGDDFGSIVDLSADGSRLSISSRLYVRVFDWNGSNWVQSGSDISNGGIIHSMTNSGNRIVALDITSFLKSRVFDWNGTEWAEQGEIPFTSNVVISDQDNRVLIGNNSTNSAKVYEFSLGCSNSASASDEVEVFAMPITPIADVTPASCDAPGEIAFTSVLGTDEAYYISTDNVSFEKLETASIPLDQGPATAITYYIKIVNETTGCESEVIMEEIAAVVCDDECDNDGEAPVLTIPDDATLECGCVVEGVVYGTHKDDDANGVKPLLGEIDPLTGTFTEIGVLVDKTTGDRINMPGSLAISSDGTLYAVTNSFASFGRSLYKINACTAEAEFIGTYDSGSNSGIKGIAFDETGRLLGLEWSIRGMDVFEFDLSDGSVSTLYDNAFPAQWYGGMEKDPNSNLMYVSSWDDGLIRSFNPSTGVVTVVVSTPVVPIRNAADLFFGSDGTLYLTTGRNDGSGPGVYEIDVVNGTSTKVSSFNLPNQRGVPGATSILTISIDAAYSAGVATATDNCDETPAITFSDVETPGDCPSEKTITRTWTATDASGNSVSDDQIINIVDTQAPKAPSPPADVSVTCLEDVPEPVDLTAEDNCEDPFTVSPTDVSTPGSNPGEYTIVRTWTFTDACDNTSSVSQTITVADPNGECESCEGLIDTTNVAATTCDPSMVGVMDTVLTNQFGCDSVVITTTTLLPNDTTNVAATTCDPSMVGVMDTVLTNQFGCDSVVITTTTLLPNDTTNVAATTCDPSMVGVMDTVLTNQIGCDSVVITTTTLLPNDTTNVAATTCDPSMVGVMDTVLTNQFGCDSVVITTTTLLPNDTTNVAATTCDPSMVGVMDTVLTNQFGCDSVVITTTTLLPNDTTNVAATTCDPSMVGVMDTVLTNQIGCDSVVITTTTLLPNDTTNVAATTCDPSMVGVMDTVLTNQFGCDSVVITTTTLLPNDTTNVAATTCDPSMVGVMDTVLTNQFGCDSVVITTTTLLPNDTTNVAATTCDPSMVGVMDTVLTNQFGCDSVVITTTTLLPGDICGDCEPTLISQGKPTKMPCEYGFSTSDLGVDGDPGGNTPWTSNPDLVHVCQRFQDPWWEVDLEEQSEISEVCIYNRISTNQYLVNRLSNFYVLIACEPFDENASLDELLADENIYHQFIAGPAGYPTCIELPQVVGQYVRIQMPGTETLHFGEVEVYGCPSDADCGPQPDPCAFLPKPVIEPAGPFLSSDGPQQLVVNPAEGMWMGPVSATGVFDPSMGAGTYAVGYRLVDGDCEKMDMVEIVVQDPSSCNTPTNQAIGKPAMQSSTYGFGIASIAVDGDLDGSRGPWSNASIQHTGQGDPQAWWKVDLEGTVEVKKVEIYNRTDCCTDRLRDFYVFVSNSPIDASRSIGDLTSDAAIEYVSHAGAAGTVEMFDFDVTAQFVAIKLTGNGPLHMAEVKVLGCPAGPPVECDIPTPGISVTPPSDCNTADGSIYVTGVSGSMLEFSLDPNGPYQYPTGITFDGLVAGEYTLYVRDREQPECVREIPVEVIPDGGCGTDCTNPSNLTSGATASQSSTYGNGSASFAIDGNMIGDSPWSANLQHTNTEASPWWSVELQGVSQIEEVKLYNRSNCCMDRLKDFYVFASENPIDGNMSIGMLTSNPNIKYIYFPGAAGAMESFDFGGIDAQYILVKLGGNGTLHMAEVEVLGCGSHSAGSRFGAANSDLDASAPIRMEAYPNPFSGSFTLKIDGALTLGSRLQLANSLGQILVDREVEGNESLELGEGLAKGMYFVQVVDGEKIHQLKVVKLK